MGYIIAMSGTHGTGKSTAAGKEYRDLKINYPEKSVKVITDLENNKYYPINKDATPRSQAWLFVNHIRNELKYISLFDIVVMDRTVVDIIGYTAALGFVDQAEGMLSFAATHMSIYKKIYFRKIIGNPYNHADWIRETEDRYFRHDVEAAIDHGYEILKTKDQFPGDLYHV